MFLKRLKDEITIEKQRGMKNKLVVSTRDFMQLLEGYEKMDAEFRCIHEDKHIVWQRELDNILTLAFKKGISIEVILWLVLNILQPLLKEKLEMQQILNLSERYDNV